MQRRTCEELEHRERVAIEAESDAALAIAALFLELALRLPDESSLIRAFADHARVLDLMSGDGQVALVSGPRWARSPGIS